MSQLTIQKGNNGFFTTQEQAATRKTTWSMGALIFGPATNMVSNNFSLRYEDGATVFDNKLYADIINGDTATAFASADALETYIQTNFFRKAGGSSGATQNTGTALVFTGDAVYGTTASPETGNITASIVGAVLGASVLVIHNNSAAPTFDSKFKKLSGSGTYVINVLNYIYCQYIDPTHILYSISQ